MFKYTQRTFNGGLLDKELMGRQDLSKYFSGASVLKNFLVRRQGNISKRRGTDFCAKITNLLGHTRDRTRGTKIVNSFHRSRIIPLVYERELGYYAMMTGNRAFIVNRSNGVYCNDGVWRKDMVDYYIPKSRSGVCTDGDPDCYIDNVPYSSLSKAIAYCYLGGTVRLAKDVSVSGTIGISMKGVTLDLNGHNINFEGGSRFLCSVISSYRDTVKNRIIDSTHKQSKITWSCSVKTGHHVAIKVSSGGFEIDGVKIVHDFTGSNATLLHLGSYGNGVRGKIKIDNANIRSTGGKGVIYLYGRNTAVNSVDLDIANTYVNYSNDDTTKAAIQHQYPADRYGRKVTILNGTHLSCGNYPAANGSLFIDGGWVSATAIGSSVTTYGCSKMIRGISTNAIASGFIQTGSSYIGDSTQGEATVKNYNLTGQGLWNYERVLPAETDPVVDYDYSPYSVEIPYEDGDLDTLDYFQSGDTIFLAHKYYPPSKLGFTPSTLKLSFENIKFNAVTWKRPVISSCVSSINLTKQDQSVSGSTTYETDVTYSINENACSRTTAVYKVSSGSRTLQTSSTSTLAPRTIQYVVTYVKDGVESVPSNPVQVTYGAPWESGGKVTINFNRGQNTDEPDYYNIYKKESTEFGLIGSTTKPYCVDLFPEVSGWHDGSGDDEDSYYADPLSVETAAFNGKPLQETNTLDILNMEEDSVLTDTPSRVIGEFGEYDVYRGVGGIEFTGAEQAVFDFGGASGVSSNSFVVCFDSHTIRYVENTATGKIKVYDYVQLSGKKVLGKCYYKNKVGDQTEASQSVTVNLNPFTYTNEDGTTGSAYSGSVLHYCGEIDVGAPFSVVKEMINKTVRKATFTFSSMASGEKQVTKIRFKCMDEEVDPDEGTTTDVIVSSYINAIKFLTNDPRESKFDDDYITPDMSITPPSSEAAFRGRGNYPSCVGIYQQRLIFATTKEKPFAFWMSATGDLYNFAPHSSIREDDPISAELSATEFPNINHIIVNRDIIMLGDGGEWKIAPVSGNTITYKTVSATLQSCIGSAKWLKPMTVGEQVIFAERTGETLRSIVYNFSSDGYESTDLSVLSSNIFNNNRILRMCYKQHPDSTIECVLADGRIATMVYMPEHEVAAWSVCELGGGMKATDIASSKALDGNTTDVLMTVKRGTDTLLIAVRPDLPEMTIDSQVCMDCVTKVTGTEAATAFETGMTGVDISTGAVVNSAAGFVADHNYLLGWCFDAEMATVRPEPQGQGTIQFEIKNAKDAEIRVLESGAWKVAPFGFIDHSVYAQSVVPQMSASAGALTLDSRDHKVLLTGKNNGDGRIHVKSVDPFPFSILSISVNYEIQPMSNQEG